MSSAIARAQTPGTNNQLWFDMGLMTRSNFTSDTAFAKARLIAATDSNYRISYYANGSIHYLAYTSDIGGGGGVTTIGSPSTSYANGATISGPILTLGYASSSNPGILSTGTQTIAGAKTFSGILGTSSYLVTGGLYGSPGTPSIAAGAGAGTSPTLTIIGTNICGQIILTPGTTPTGLNAVIATITFANSFAANNAPVIMITPGNAATALLSGATMVYTTNSTLSAWTLNCGTTALTTGTQYIWNYQAMVF